MSIGVLVTGVGSGSTGEQVYRALREGKRPYRIAVANVDLGRSIVATGARRVVLPPASAPNYLLALAETANALDARFIVPGSDVELVRVAQGRDTLARLTPAVPLVNDLAAISVCLDKGATAAALGRAGLRAPRTLDCTTIDALVAGVAQERLAYPLVLKPRRGGGSADVYVAQDEEELRFHAARILRSGTAAIAQEYVGSADAEYTVGVLSFPDGTLAGSFALRRDLGSMLSCRFRTPNRTGRAELGPQLAVSSGFSQGEVDDFPEVRAQAEAVARAIGSRGPLNVQGRLVGSELVVFEVNPRFSGTEAMRAMAGWNAAEALIEWHLGLGPTISAFRAQPCTFIRTVVEYRLDRPPAPRLVQAPPPGVAPSA
ncbi:MAG: ATP-grasp domain-containing protein [Deltaproteobacteria bacterium]|nr:ATP-grasp domain-containing protein [Deltaproteobacteria bacterium]